MLGQGAGQNHALFFTAGQGGEGVVFKAVQAHRFEGVFRQLAVGLGVAVEQAFVRGAAHRDHFVDGQAKSIGEFLQHHGDALCAPAGRLLPQVVLFEMHAAGFRLAEAIGAAQQAGFAAAVRPDQPHELPCGHVQAGITQVELVMAMAVAQRRPGELSEGETGHKKSGGLS